MNVLQDKRHMNDKERTEATQWSEKLSAKTFIVMNVHAFFVPSRNLPTGRIQRCRQCKKSVSDPAFQWPDDGFPATVTGQWGNTPCPTSLKNQIKIWQCMTKPTNLKSQITYRRHLEWRMKHLLPTNMVRPNFLHFPTFGYLNLPCANWEWVSCQIYTILQIFAALKNCIFFTGDLTKDGGYRPVFLISAAVMKTPGNRASGTNTENRERTISFDPRPWSDAWNIFARPKTAYHRLWSSWLWVLWWRVVRWNTATDRRVGTFPINLRSGSATLQYAVLIDSNPEKSIQNIIIIIS